METIKSGLRALWKVLYPLMVYYLSVFAVEVIFQTWGIQINTTIDIILPGAALTLAILWFPYKRDWIFRQGLIKKPFPSPVPMWEHLIILGVAASISGNIWEIRIWSKVIFLTLFTNIQEKDRCLPL